MGLLLYKFDLRRKNVYDLPDFHVYVWSITNGFLPASSISCYVLPQTTLLDHLWSSLNVCYCRLRYNIYWKYKPAHDRSILLNPFRPRPLNLSDRDSMKSVSNFRFISFAESWSHRGARSHRGVLWGAATRRGVWWQCQKPGLADLNDRTDSCYIG